VKEYLTDVDVQVVLTFADNDMNATETGKKLFMYRTTVTYHLERVGAKTGLSPFKFYDLVKLVGILKETEG
jgi:sugar diacid utilization regulator